LFDPVIDERHGGYGPNRRHPTDTDWTKLVKNEIDPKYVISTRVRTGRSIAGIPLPPSCTLRERRKVEELVTTALTNLRGDLKGDY